MQQKQNNPIYFSKTAVLSSHNDTAVHVVRDNPRMSKLWKRCCENCTFLFFFLKACDMNRRKLNTASVCQNKIYFLAFLV